MRLTPRVAGFRSEYPAGFKLECMAGFVGTRTEMDRIVLRPNRSASGPAESEPTTKPNNAALKTGPNADRSMPHSETSEGAM